MPSLLHCLFVCSFLCASVGQHDNDKEQTSFHENHKDDQEHLYEHIRDKVDFDGQGMRHIKEHLVKIATVPNVDNLENVEDSQAIYYFFKLHDFDNNNRLDGLELIAAFTDYHETPDSKHTDVLAGYQMLETEVERVVDELITNHDLDGDGYLSWQEVASTDSRLLMNKIHEGLA